MSAEARLPRWAQAGLIAGIGAAAAAALWLAQPRRGDLGPVDFTAGGPDALQFCDPLHPRFIAVANKVSPVVLTEKAPGLFSLRTATGKRVGPADLEDGRLRLFAVDDGIERFAAGEAQFAGQAGRWKWAPPGGTTVVFADFKPVATGEEMYASARLAPSPTTAEGSARGIGLVLQAPASIGAGQEIEIRADGPAAPGAQLAAFDLGRAGPTGFVIHDADQTQGQSAVFRLTFNDPGHYVLWCVAGDARARREITVVP